MITSRQYRYLTDFTTVYDFLIDIYERATGATVSLCRFWNMPCPLPRWTNGICTATAFVFTESEPFNIFFSLRPGYESLAEKMVSYAEIHMITQNRKQHFILFEGQQALIDAVRNRGYQKTGGHIDLIYDFEQNGPLAFPLPSGYRFVKKAELDQEKILRCLWKGFNHKEEEGLWDTSYMDDAYLLTTAPHYTPQYPAVIGDGKKRRLCMLCRHVVDTPEPFGLHRTVGHCAGTPAQRAGRNGFVGTAPQDETAGHHSHDRRRKQILCKNWVPLPDCLDGMGKINSFCFY